MTHSLQQQGKVSAGMNRQTSITARNVGRSSANSLPDSGANANRVRSAASPSIRPILTHLTFRHTTIINVCDSRAEIRHRISVKRDKPLILISQRNRIAHISGVTPRRLVQIGVLTPLVKPDFKAILEIHGNMLTMRALITDKRAKQMLEIPRMVK
ncbi:MAG: hypothetical protein CMK92_04740 [Pseudomonas sp.]|nr:hypothetical protein [Pseudomonas sp.]